MVGIGVIVGVGVIEVALHAGALDGQQGQRVPARAQQAEHDGDGPERLKPSGKPRNGRSTSRSRWK